MKILEKVALGNYTTFKVGGLADYFCEIQNIFELREALSFAREKNISIKVIGGGSNLLVSDEGYRGLVIHNKILGFKLVTNEGEFSIFEAGSGYIFDDFVREIVELGFVGVETLSYIPGTLGGAIVQNAGAYGAEVGDSVYSVLAINVKTLEERVFEKSALNFSYRNSFFKQEIGKDWVIISVMFRLKKNDYGHVEYKDLIEYFKNKENITDTASLPKIPLREVRNAVIEIRKSKLPDWKVVPTAGSYFKNPIITKAKYLELKNTYPELPGFDVPGISGRAIDEIKIPLGYVLDKICGLKGCVSPGGNVGLYEKQALVIVGIVDGKNTKLSAKDVKDLEVYISRIVLEKVGIKIEAEVEYLC